MNDNSGKEQNAEAYQHAHRAAVLIQQHQDDILNRWLDATMARVASAKDQGRAELADHLKNLLDEITHILTSVDANFCPESIPEFEFEPSAMHGRERATLKGYTVGQLAHEHIILRHVIVVFCSERNLGNGHILDVISRVIEFASLTAITEFARSLQEVQQKLVGTLIHDVRTPLGVAANYVEVLSLPNVSAEQKDTAVKTIAKSLGRAVSMLEEILDTVKLDAGRGLLMRFEQSDINKAVKSICAEAKHVYAKQIIASLEDHPVTGIFDEALVIRTVENLISNAVKFGYEQTPITISLDDRGDQVNICVHNKGEPISKHNIEEIFAFFSSPTEHHSNAKGWGLGLALIKTVAKSHGGRVILESTQSDGTTFGMTLRKDFRRDGEELSILL